MALEIVAAKELNHVFEIVSVSHRKTMKHHMVAEPEGLDGFLYDTRNALKCFPTAAVRLTLYCNMAQKSFR